MDKIVFHVFIYQVVINSKSGAWDDNMINE
jgi:hypothetical protein